MKAMFLLGVLFFSSLSLAEADMKIFFKNTRPFQVRVAIVEKQPGQLKAWVDALTEQKTTKLFVENSDKTIKFVCETSKVSTSCAFQFVEKFPGIFIDIGTGFFAKDIDLSSFTGLDAIKNSNLQIPLELKNSKEFFTLHLGGGKLTAGGGLISE